MTSSTQKNAAVIRQTSVSVKQPKLRRMRRGAAKATRSLGMDILLFIFLGALALFMLIPILYVVANAFKPLSEFFIFPPRPWVVHPTLENFVQLSQLLSNMWVPFSRYLFNSIVVTVSATLGNVLVASMAAYPLAMHNFRGRKLINEVIILALLFTPQVLYIPQYIVIANIGLINNYLALILPVVQTTLGTFLMVQFMQQVPLSLLEAARIDGAAEMKIWWEIVMPTVKPAWLTLMILAFQQIWAQNGNLLIYKENMKVLPAIMTQIQSGGLARAGVTSAVMFVLMIPPLVLFEFSQKAVIETMATSGIKD
jgi:putative chitobiose transport system permease protein